MRAHNAQRREQWSLFWSDRRNRTATLLGMVCVLVSVALIRWTITRIEMRRGIELLDPVLASLPVVDLTSIIFLLIYGSVVVALWGVSMRPRRFLMTLYAYALLLLLRSMTLWLVPLEPPADMIVLRDPVVQAFLPYSDRPPTKDLFFSGHVATAVLFSLTAGSGWTKLALAAAALLLAALLVLQHVHYTLDLIAAPLFALGSYWTVLHFQPQSCDHEEGTSV
jgi:hypothetical protein